LHLFGQELDIRIINEDRYNMMTACDVVVAASGTVTLELAILEIPMVVCYKLSPLTYCLGKLLVKIEHFSLPNLIAGYGAVPEFLQAAVTADNIADELTTLLSNPARMNKMKDALRGVKDKLGDAGASEKAAAVALKLLRGHHE
jgi:lipid-A-disaccharide synthase